MKMIGLIGGLTPESTAVYYRVLNQLVRDRLGPGTSSKIMLSSFNLADVMPLYLNAKPKFIDAIADAGQRLKKAGADGLMILSNTAHMGAQNLSDATGMPVIHILDALAATINSARAKQPLLLGTDFVMEGDYYRGHLDRLLDGKTLVPNRDDCKIANDILFSELANGVFSDASRQVYLGIIDKAEAAGADSVILGCTEHCLLLNQSHHRLPIFDSTHIHANAAVDFQLGTNK